MISEPLKRFTLRLFGPCPWILLSCFRSPFFGCRPVVFLTWFDVGVDMARDIRFVIGGYGGWFGSTGVGGAGGCDNCILVVFLLSKSPSRHRSYYLTNIWIIASIYDSVALEVVVVVMVLGLWWWYWYYQCYKEVHAAMLLTVKVGPQQDRGTLFFREAGIAEYSCERVN